MQDGEIHRFDIYWVNDEPHGQLSGGPRPYLIVTPYCDNQNRNTLIGAPITSNTKVATETTVPVQIEGRDSLILMDCLAVIDKSRLEKLIGKLDVERALAAARILNEQFIPETYSPAVIKQRFVLNAVVPFEEDRRHEFKEITSARPANVIKNAADEYAVAFLNSEGGRIFWGIRDSDRTVTGVKLTPAERDEVRKEVVGKVAGIQPHVDIVQLRLEFHEVLEDRAIVADLFVVELSVPRGEPTTMHFTSGGDAFVRLDGVKLKLKGPQIQQWILGRMRAAEQTGLSPAERKRDEIIKWKGKIVTLSTMNSGRAAMLLGPVRGTAAVMVVDCTGLYVTVSINGTARSIPLSRVEVSFDNANGRLDLQEHHE
jgi:mRNA-degrading endonuclease toxin of MazEF toxin-antitoxin module